MSVKSTIGVGGAQPPNAPNARGANYVSIDLDDGMGELAATASQFGESAGTVKMSAAAAHPYMAQSSMLKFGLVLYAFLALLGPIHIYQFRDPASAHQDMFNFSFLLFLLLQIQFYRTRLEEWWIYVRWKKQNAASHIGGRLVVAYGCLVLSFVMQMFLSEYEEASGQLEFSYIVSSASGTGCLMIIAILFLYRQERCFLIDDLSSAGGRARAR